MSEEAGLEEVRRQLRAASEVAEQLARVEEVTRGADGRLVVRQVWAGRARVRRPDGRDGDE